MGASTTRGLPHPNPTGESTLTPGPSAARQSLPPSSLQTRLRTTTEAILSYPSPSPLFPPSKKPPREKKPPLAVVVVAAAVAVAAVISLPPPLPSQPKADDVSNEHTKQRN